MGPNRANWLDACASALAAGVALVVHSDAPVTPLGPAHTLGLDHEIGSIECVKRADFCVLEDDPLECDPAALKDLRVWGTVLSGRVFEARRVVSAAPHQHGRMHYLKTACPGARQAIP